MNVTLAYLGRSAVSRAGSTRTVTLAPNLSRDPVAFEAPLLQPLRFREAISALHDVVVSDLRFHRRDKTAYLEWKRQEATRQAAIRREAMAAERKRAAEAQKAVPPELAREHKQAVKRYWRARDAFGRRLNQRDHRLWWVLDPVITVAEDVAYFECFSQDESSYGCLSVARDGGFGADPGARLGTTNVDYSWELYNHFQSLRSYRETRFSIDPQGFDVAVAEQPGYREEKVDLPSSWLRGFLQLQQAMGLPMRRVSLSREAVYSLLAWLRRHKAKESPRAVRFELLDGRAPRLVLEPWERPIVSHGTVYHGPDTEPVRVWGRQRLLSLARLLPLCEGVDVHLLGTGFPSFWVARMGEMRLTLGLSGWTQNDWTRATALDLLAPPVKPNAALVERVARFVRGRGAASLEQVAADALCSPAEAAAALGRLAHAGQVIRDLSAGLFRWRQIMARELGEAEIGPEHPELSASRHLVLGGKVQLEGEEAVAGRGTLYTGRVGGKPVEALIDGDGLFKRARCVCGHHRKAGLRMGPCRHLLALRQYVQGRGDRPRAAALDAWYEGLSRP